MSKKQMAKQIISMTKIPLIYLCSIVVIMSLFRPILVSGHSMDKTLHDKQFVIGTKLNMDSLNRGDIVVASAHSGDDTASIIKRVIGLPGEQIEIKNNQVFINGKIFSETYLPEQMKTKNLSVTLKENEYFCMGDNRNHSMDSRVLGAIPRSDIRYRIIIH